MNTAFIIAVRERISVILRESFSGAGQDRVEFATERLLQLFLNPQAEINMTMLEAAAKAQGSVPLPPRLIHQEMQASMRRAPSEIKTEIFQSDAPYAAPLPSSRSSVASSTSQKRRRRKRSRSPELSASPASATVGESTGKRTRLPSRWTSDEDEKLREAVNKHGARNWKTIAKEVEGRDHVQCLQRWNKVLKPGLVKGPWTDEENSLLKELVPLHQSNWAAIAACISGRTPKQCRERWVLNLDPSINRNPFSPEEDELLLHLWRELGPKWAEIKKSFNGRTENAVKTRWKSLMRGISKEFTAAQEDELLKLDAELHGDHDEVAQRLRLPKVVVQTHLQHLKSQEGHSSSSSPILRVAGPEAEPAAEALASLQRSSPVVSPMSAASIPQPPVIQNIGFFPSAEGSQSAMASASPSGSPPSTAQSALISHLQAPEQQQQEQEVSHPQQSPRKQ